MSQMSAVMYIELAGTNLSAVQAAWYVIRTLYLLLLGTKLTVSVGGHYVSTIQDSRRPTNALTAALTAAMEKAYQASHIFLIRTVEKKPVAVVSTFPLAWNWSLHMYVLEVKERTFSLPRSRSTSTSVGIDIAVGNCGTHH